MSTTETSLTIGELAAMSGIPVHTIRAWERRHAVLSPERTTAGHRRYTVEDVATLRQVRNHVAARGVSLKVAVAMARGEFTDEVPRPPSLPLVLLEDAAGGTPWRAVVDLLADVVCILDADGRILDANRCWAATLGTPRAEIPGTRLVDYVEAHDRAKATRLYRPRLQSLRGWELNLRTPAGAGLFSFDAQVLAGEGPDLLALMGRPLDDAGAEHWPDG